MKRMLLLSFLLSYQAAASAERGELLYQTHCHACHGPEMHQRNRKIATDWGTLLAQVRRWESNIDLQWSQEEITDVAHYLNQRYYGFPEPGHRQSDHALSPSR